MVTNLGFYFETQKEVRGGKFIWWGDTNPTLKKNQLLGGDLLNPKKGFDHFYAGQLGKYVPGGGLSEDQAGITIYRAFTPHAAATASTTIVLNATGWDDAPEVGMVVMVAPNAIATNKLVQAYDFVSANPADTSDVWATGKAAIIATETNKTTVQVIENSVEGWTGKNFVVLVSEPDADTFYTLYEADGVTDAGVKVKIGATPSTEYANIVSYGQSAKITAIEYDKTAETFTVTVDTALTVATTDILVEAKGTAASAEATPLVDYVNMWIEADRDLLPTDGFGIKNGHYYLSGVSGCAAYIGRMQPLTKYILAQNKSLIDGVFEL